MAPPLGQKRILAVDPGFRTGCKVVCLDAQGKLLHYEALFPHTGAADAVKASERFRRLCRDYSVEFIAVGNGTAGRETESFLRDLGMDVPVIMVNESGASVYSASEIARCGISGQGHHGAWSGVDRKAVDGSAGGAGQD